MRVWRNASSKRSYGSAWCAVRWLLIEATSGISIFGVNAGGDAIGKGGGGEWRSRRDPGRSHASLM
eukprot:13155234-Alexandrium_andersonii.AAC.1